MAMAMEMPPTTQENLSSSSNSGMSFFLYTHLIHKDKALEGVRPKESAWYLISPTSESGKVLSRDFAGVHPPDDGGFDICRSGLAAIGPKLYLIGGCRLNWTCTDCNPYYSAIRCLDTRADPLGWKTISHLPAGYLISRTAVSAPWIYVFGRSREARTLAAVSQPWGYAINVDDPEKTFPLPAPYPRALCPSMCAVVEDGLLFHDFNGDTLHLLNLKDLTYSLHKMPGVIPKNEYYDGCMNSCGVFFRYNFYGTILAYDTVRRVHLPRYKIQPQLFEWFGHECYVWCMFPALDGKIGLFMHSDVYLLQHRHASYGVMCAAYVEFSMLYRDDSAEMVVHRKQKLYLHGDGDIDIVPRYPLGDQVDMADEQQQEKSTKKKLKKKKKRRGKK